MKVYIDTSALVKLYYPEKESEVLAAWIKQKNQPILFSSFHELELKNAFALKVFRNELTSAQQKAIYSVIDTDISKGVLFRISLDWGAVFIEAIELIKSHTHEIGSRSFDIFHIATAIVNKCSHIITFDERQVKLAIAAKLKTIDL